MATQVLKLFSQQNSPNVFLLFITWKKIKQEEFLRFVYINNTSCLKGFVIN